MRISTLPLAIGAAAIALGSLIAPPASAADLTINNDVCEIAFTDGEIEFFQSKFIQARVNVITTLKADIPAATVELNEMQKLLEEADFEASNPSLLEKHAALAEKISVKAAAAGFHNIENGSEIINEVNVALGFLPHFTFFENLGIHYWNIYYNHDTDLLQLPSTSAATVLNFMNLPFEVSEVLRDELSTDPGMSARGIKLVEDAFAPLQDLRTPFTPVFEACASGQPGTIIGDKIDDVPEDDQEPVVRSNSSSFGSS